MNTRKRKIDKEENAALKKRKFNPKGPKDKIERCSDCKQNLQEVVFFNGRYNGSVEEFVALTDEKLLLFTGNENAIHESDAVPTERLTEYTIYDEKGHLCSIDSGLIEKNVILHLSGYMKRIDDEDSSINNGIPAHDIGPINEWFITGFDGGQRALIGVVTPYAQYLLMEPASDYHPFVKILNQKKELLKLIVEYLLDHAWEDPTYEDLFFHLENSRGTEFSEDFLLQHSQFICDQIYSFDQAGDDDKPLITTPCVRDLVKMAGVTFRMRKQMRMRDPKTIQKKTGFSKATTTELVRSVFEHFFPDQIEVNDVKGLKKKRCGVCDVCQSSDCGKCVKCKDMIKFGGTGKSKQACKQRRCPNMAVLDADESENENDIDNSDLQVGKKKKVVCAKRNVNKVEWVGESLLEIKGRKFYNEAVVGNATIKRGDFILLNPENPNDPLYIGKVEYMYEQLLKGQIVHANIFYRGNETILGETADPQELFVADICEDAPLGSIIRKAEVSYRGARENWEKSETNPMSPSRLEDDGHTFFYSKKYKSHSARFVDYVPQFYEGINICSCCMQKRLESTINKPIFNGSTVMWLDTIYKIGSAVFLDPSVYKYKISKVVEDDVRPVDETIFTEYYRKNSDVKGSNLDTPEPFRIGLIESLAEKSGDIKVVTRIFHRPENTKCGVFLAHQKDINLIYWTDELVTCSFDKVVGKCFVKYYDDLENPDDWVEDGPYRFYFTESYNTKTCEIGDVPDFAKKIRYVGKKGKGNNNKIKGKGKVEHEQDVAPNWGKIERPLRCMDVFAGCGGLSEGLHQAGVAETKWAIEKETAAAHAFELNNPGTKMYIGDCNDILRNVISGEGSLKNLPSRGDVELLVGGPPCQGFSGMNRFNAGQYSLFKNSLVATYLSYCEYYRPKYFILENVRNFVSFKRSMVLKLTLRCLLAMGYQVSFGVLQAGHYGVPQTRRRLILIAAAPGYVLPTLPEPQYVFNRRGCHLSFALDGLRYSNGNLWAESAPYRTICVRDALSDLPDISNGWNQTEMPYDDEATSHFQRKMRKGGSDTHVIDHVCKEMAPIVQARIAHIPEIPGSDWRDLPNIVVKLRDGSETSKLKYPFRLKKQSIDEPPRGVCQCATGKTCKNYDRQLNTLIPWCLPHTADRHNHWAGLYGRLEWDGFFGTTITNPEPMGKQGRVLHPDQNRVVSVRECARSQGFPDRFKFYGNVLDKHRQVGNAVPPPLGKAIGLEIRKALCN